MMAGMTTRTACLLSLGVMLALSAPAAHAIYKCQVDGRIVYQDRPCTAAGPTSEILIPPKAAAAKSPETARAPPATAVPANSAGDDIDACGPIPVDDEHREKLKRVAKLAVAKALKDPDSARFDAEMMHARLQCADGKREFVCGKVNSKNSYGGYGGSKIWLFAMTDGGYITWHEEESTELKAKARMWTAVGQCYKFGH